MIAAKPESAAAKRVKRRKVRRGGQAFFSGLLRRIDDAEGEAGAGLGEALGLVTVGE